MSTNASASANGMMYPTTKGMVGSNPADSARVSMLNKAQSQTTANQLMAGGKVKRRRIRYGGASSIVVPQYQMLYEPQGGIGTNPNDQIQGNSQTSTQMNANAVYDSYATTFKKGGAKSKSKYFSSTFSKSRRGGNADWIWGCMSGGKKRSRKCRTTRRNKHKKTRNSRKQHRKH